MSRAYEISRFAAVIVLTFLLTATATLALSAQDGGSAEPAGGGADPAGNGEPERGPEPVTSVVAEETQEGPDEPGQVLYFKRWAAETFTAYDSTNSWAYDGGGCFHRTGGSSWWDIDVQLPDGAEIDYLRVFYYDVDGARDAEAALYEFDNAGGNVVLATASGAGAPGYSSAASGFFSHIVDNLDHSYIVRIDFNGSSSNALRICAVRIRYSYSFSNLSLPAIYHTVP